MNGKKKHEDNSFRLAMSSETSWLERVLIALSESHLNLLNEYNSSLTRKLHSAQRCSDKGLILFLADKRKLFRDFRAETYIPANIISEDSKKESKTASGSKVSLYLLCLSYLYTDTMEAKLTLKLITEAYLQVSEHLEPWRLSFSFTPCCWMIVIAWRDCFTYLLTTVD